MWRDWQDQRAGSTRCAFLSATSGAVILVDGVVHDPAAGWLVLGTRVPLEELEKWTWCGAIRVPAGLTELSTFQPKELGMLVALAPWGKGSNEDVLAVAHVMDVGDVLCMPQAVGHAQLVAPATTQAYGFKRVSLQQSDADLHISPTELGECDDRLCNKSLASGALGDTSQLDKTTAQVVFLLAESKPLPSTTFDPRRRALGYGEMLPVGFLHLANVVSQLRNDRPRLLDLGSGLGGVVAMAAALKGWHAEGIEVCAPQPLDSHTPHSTPSAHSTLHTPHPVHTPHSSLHTAHCTLHTPHSTPIPHSTPTPHSTVTPQ